MRAQIIQDVMVSAELIKDAKVCFPLSISDSQQETAFHFKDGSVLSILKAEESRLILTAGEEGKYTVRLRFKLRTGQGRPSAFIPAVWYNGNLKGEGCYPSLRRTPEISFSETRMAIPGAVAVSWGESHLLFTAAPAEKMEELSVSGFSSDGISFTLPGTEKNASYRSKTLLADTSKEAEASIHLDAGEKLERSFSIISGEDEDVISFYEKFLRSRYKDNSRCQVLSWKEYAVSKLTRLLNMARRSRDGNAYLIMGEGNGAEQSVYDFTAASFLVKSLQAAVSFIKTPKEIAEADNIHLKEARHRIASLLGLEDDAHLLENTAKKIADFFLRCETSPGCFQDNINIRTGEMGGYLGIGEHPEFRTLINARCNGEAMSAYLELFKALGKKEYYALMTRVARFYTDAQLPDGSFGRWWTKRGKPADKEGTNGAYMALFLLRFAKHIEDEELRGEVQSAVTKALSFYTELALKGDFNGDTLDADSCDKEAGIAVLALLLEAKKQGASRQGLTRAIRKAAAFILTWIWQEDSYLPPASPCCEAGFTTKGMTSVSVAHHHLDFYGMLIAADFFRLSIMLEDPFYETQARLMAAACTQLIADDGNMLGRSRSFAGWQPEQINHTFWDYFNRPERMLGYYDIDIAWTNVLGYSSLIDMLEMGVIGL